MEDTMWRYRRCYRLVQQSPFLHFQHYEHKATLRASEVKPKLDRFLMELCGGEQALFSEHPNWRRGYVEKGVSAQFPALDYKMQIRAKKEIGKSRCTETAIAAANGDKVQSEQIKGYFFSNQPIYKPCLESKMRILRNYKEAMWYRDGLELTIICFVPELLELIHEHIAEFFLAHNFGTRKTMGFGSFLVENTDIRAELKKTSYLPLQKAFYIETPYRAGDPKFLEDIMMIARLMKVGINLRDGDYMRGFIFRYFHKKGIGNEKAFIKKNKNLLGSFYPDEKREEEPDTEYRFVRAMLGLGRNFYYSKVRQEVSYKAENRSISCFCMPLSFKIAENYILILPNTIPDALFDAPFSFSCGDHKEILYTPTKEQFDLDEFLRAFAEDFNDKTAKKGGDTTLATAKNQGLRRLGGEDYIIKEGTELE